MKNIYSLFFISGIIFLSGCGMTPLGSGQSHTFASKLFSVAYSGSYEARESGSMLIVSSASGKIIIGGFTPSIGHPEANEGNITFKEITYTKDPKVNGDAVPVALYYRNGDTKTETELLDILKTVQ